MKTFNEWLWSRNKQQNPAVKTPAPMAPEEKPEYKAPSSPQADSGFFNPDGSWNDGQPKGLKPDNRDRAERTADRLYSEPGKRNWHSLRAGLYDFIKNNSYKSLPNGFTSRLWPDAEEFTKEEATAVYKGVVHKTLEEMSKYIKFNSEYPQGPHYSVAADGWGKDADKWLRSFLNHYMANTSQDHGLNSYSLKGLPTPEELEEAEEIFEVWKDASKSGARDKDDDKWERGLRRLVHLRHPKSR